MPQCFNCGAQTEDWDELPNGKKVYICHDNSCTKELRDTCREVESDMIQRAEEDNYDRYR